MVPEKSVGSCGMTIRKGHQYCESFQIAVYAALAILLRKSVNPIVEMSTPSNIIDPELSSTSRYNATMMLHTQVA